MVDLSSDTCTRPTQAMREAIKGAEVGDEQRREDPTVKRLLQEVCSLLGKPAALFLPSGTMCNLVAVKTHTQPGDACFVGHNCHILRCETGAAAAVSGVVLDIVGSDHGIFGGPALEEAIFELGPYSPNPRLVCVEQTHNFAGGRIWPQEKMLEIQEVARRRGLQVHMDGARLFNAAVATGLAPSDLVAPCDSVWVDFTKGLGAPLGAVLCGSEEFMARAVRYKHMFGGALRQAGMMAAGCLYALHNHLDRLADDHRRATDLATFLATFPGVEVSPVETNLVFFTIRGMDPEAFLAGLECEQVRMGAVGPRLRAVTHLDVDDTGMEKAKQAVARVLGAAPLSALPMSGGCQGQA